MPSDEPELRRGSLRRLGSFANATFNPFSRRRSQASDAMTIASSKSTLSIPAPPSGSAGLQGSTASLVPSTHDHNILKKPELPSSHRRRSYIPIPDDSCHALPKHRTLSSLPLPAIGMRPVSISKPASSVLLPPSRIPTPKAELRTRLSVGTKVLKPVKYKGLQRSDTEPLLSRDTGLSFTSTSAQSTAFKENLTLSPSKPLPEVKILADATPPMTATPNTARQSKWSDQQDSVSLMSPVTGLRMRGATANPMSHSSPVRKPPATRTSSPATMVHRKSQPVLADRSHNVASKRASYNAGIKQHQLLKPREPPTPPVPITPMRQVTPASQRTARRDAVRHGQAGADDVDDSATASVMDSDIVRRLDSWSPMVVDAAQVSQREPIAYWCGRMSVLTDRYRNEKFLHCMNEGQPAQLENEQETHERIRRAMAHLYSVCVTEEAKASFRVSEEAVLQFLHHPLSLSFDHYDADVAVPDWDGSVDQGNMAFF